MSSEFSETGNLSYQLVELDQPKRNLRCQSDVAGASKRALDGTGTMPQHADIIDQIERCRRLAREITDADLRESLEELAQSYEARLERRGAGFMLQSKNSRRS